MAVERGVVLVLVLVEVVVERVWFRRVVVVVEVDPAEKGQSSDQWIGRLNTSEGGTDSDAHAQTHIYAHHPHILLNMKEGTHVDTLNTHTLIHM